jgi:hypothetical protein
MASVDNRTVAMQFDNKVFEERLAQTVASLDKLRLSLDMAGAKTGLSDLTKVGNNVDLSGIGAAVDGISNKFSAMGAVAFTIIQSITTST